MKSIMTLIALVAFSSVVSGQKSYTLDKNHTRIGFIATHMKISDVDGRFKSFDASLKSSKDDFTDAVIDMTADVKSIDTDIEMRDNDLRSKDWFDAEKYPKIIFKSTEFKKTDGKNYKLYGNITIRNITKPIVLDVVYNGKQMNPMSKKNSIGFTITGMLKRSDFEVGKNSSASVTVEDEIKLLCNVEFITDEVISKK